MNHLGRALVMTGSLLGGTWLGHAAGEILYGECGSDKRCITEQPDYLSTQKFLLLSGYLTGLLQGAGYIYVADKYAQKNESNLGKE
ncbi:MAG TPA: hypothetical protein PKD20_03775 [Candidatus Saccharibacteria bacterium]|jgi:hypothetical protein|nr:hypothetical protein [Candidatus Saccharibacteria bacterium]HMT55972.1 hypothetical protein [Candidatus Saccharibacteria bacterium]